MVNEDNSPEFKTGRDELFKLCKLMEKAMNGAKGVNLIPSFEGLPPACAWINSPGAVFDK